MPWVRPMTHGPMAFRISGHLGVVSRDGVTEFDEEFRMAECNTQTHPKTDTKRS